MWPSSTKLLTPSSVNFPLARVAVASTPDASQRPFGSVNASVATLSPETMGGSSAVFCASLAAFMMAVAASTAEAK